MRHLRYSLVVVVVAAVSLVAACKGDFNPVGSYSGTLMETAQVMRATADPTAGNATNTSRPQPNARVTVEAASEGHVRVRFSPMCVVLFDLDRAPNEHNGHVAATPEQTCVVSVNGYQGTVRVAGTTLFARGTNTVTQLVLHGDIREGNTTGSWGMSFDGTTPTR